MKITYKTNILGSSFTAALLRRLRKYMSAPEEGEESQLEKGKEYVVYGIVFRDNSPWYYLCVDEDDEYPIPFAADFFDVSDDRLSSYWKLSAVTYDDGYVLTSLVFKEWAEDPTYYERLIDDDSKAIKLFESYRRLINQE